MYSIGEFSKITGLSIKTLRFYHEKGLLKPSYVDSGSGYRHYDARNVERAQVVVQLRKLGFSLGEIGEILGCCDDEGEILEYLERQRDVMQARIDQHQETVKRLNQIITNEREARRIMRESTFEVEEKNLENLLIAGVRMQGKYCECGKGFAKIARRFGRHMSGKPFLLHYDQEYREDDADFEACFPVRQARDVEGISVRELPGGRCVSLLHRGPYDELGRSYAKIIDYIGQKDLHVKTPSRELYIKGPGMIFRGNPRKYLTEIQFLVEE